MKKKILALFLTLTMIIGSFSLAYTAPADVAGTDFEEAIVRLLELGVLTGYPDGSFKPGNNIRRSEYAAVAVRAKGLEQEALRNMGSTSFGDVLSNHWASGYINTSEEKGLIKGVGIVNGINSFKPEENITYEQAVTIMVRALGYETAAQEDGGWPNGYIQVADQIGLLEDVNGSLGMVASRGMVAQLTYNALEIPNMIKVGSNYIVSGTQGSDELYLFNELHMINQGAASGNWANIDEETFELAGITGVTAANIGKLKSSLQTIAAGENKNWSPLEIQGVFDNIALGNKVILAKVLNGTQIEINFNTELNLADAISTTPYKVNISGVTFSNASLSEDGKTLRLTSTSAMNLNNAALTVEPIQTADDVTVTTERYTTLISYSDTDKPEIKEIISKTNTNIANNVKVIFSEPIQSVGTVKINGQVKVPSGFSPGSQEAIFTGLSLNANQSHNIQIIGLRDQAANVASVINESFSITIDTVLPRVELSPSMDKDNVIVFEFDKPVTTVSANAVLVNGIVKTENLSNQTSSGAIPINPINGLTKKYEMAVSTPFTSLSTRNFTVVIPSGIKDELGNELASTTKTVTLKKDSIAPEIEDVGIVRNINDEVVSLVLSIDSSLDSKVIQSPIALSSKLTVLDPNGIGINTSTWLGGLRQDAITAGEKKITLSFLTPAKLNGLYQISFGQGLATDQAVSPNSLKSKSLVLDFGQETSTGTFTISNSDVSSGGSNIYLINYGAKVKGGLTTGSATDLNNYTIAGSSLPTGTMISLDSSQVIATITLPAESISTTDPAAIFTIANVKRDSGETIVPFTTLVQTDDNTKPVMDSAVLTNDNKLVVGFSESLSAIPNGTDFEIKVNGKILTIAPAFIMGTGSDAGKYVFDFTPIILNDGSQTYIDLDANGLYTPSVDVLDKLEATLPSQYSMKTSPSISSVTIKVIGNATTDNASPANALKLGTIISAK